jgi:glycine cleavage system H protein
MTFGAVVQVGWWGMAESVPVAGPLPDDRRYSTDHFWVRRAVDRDADRDADRAADGVGARCTVGMTHYCVEAMGELQSVRFPAVGQRVERDHACGELEANKSVSDIYAPISGTIVAINETLLTSPAAIAADPYGAGWLLEIEPDGDDEQALPAVNRELLDAAGYLTLIGEDQP